VAAIVLLCIQVVFVRHIDHYDEWFLDLTYHLKIFFFEDGAWFLILTAQLGFGAGGVRRFIRRIRKT
jgi:hypothetical protein